MSPGRHRHVRRLPKRLKRMVVLEDVDLVDDRDDLAFGVLETSKEPALQFF